jgi:Domain of unknown function (DUF4160)/Helix-turn-helix domain
MFLTIGNGCLNVFGVVDADDPIRRFSNYKIAIYADDHLPPHFHIEGRSFRALVEIETMTVRAGDARKAPEVGEWGWCCRWSDDLEISSDTLWRLALEQGSAWLRAWRTAHNMTQAKAASALGVSPRMWRYYEAGSHLLPKTVRLAGIGLDAQANAA